MKRRYEAWGEFLKQNREGRYRSAREFCTRAQVGISYPQYSRYEAGEQLPNLEQALLLCRLLEVPATVGLLQWSLSQVEEANARGELEELLKKVVHPREAGAMPVAAEPKVKAAEAPPVSQSAVSLDDVIVFNRSHLKVFRSDPRYRDIFTFINACAPEWVASEEIALALEIPLEELERMLDCLSDLGVVLLAGGKARASKRNFYFPDDPDFFELRNLNLIHNATRILSGLSHDELQAKKAYRGLITRELTEEQVERVAAKLDQVIGEVVALPESADAQKIYSVCVLLGKRFERPQASLLQAFVQGLKRGVIPAWASWAKPAQRTAGEEAPR